MQTFLEKISSRKFWMAVAAFLASIGTSIGALATNNDVVATAGIICAVLSAAIYAAVEAWVDTARLNSNSSVTTTTMTKNISATSSNAKDTVEKLLVTETVPQE